MILAESADRPFNSPNDVSIREKDCLIEQPDRYTVEKERGNKLLRAFW